MSLKLENSLSAPRPVPGGSLQGSIFGNILFIVTVDVLSASTAFLQAPPSPRSPAATSPGSSPISVGERPFSAIGNEMTRDLSDDGDDDNDCVRFFRNSRSFLI